MKIQVPNWSLLFSRRNTSPLLIIPKLNGVLLYPLADSLVISSDRRDEADLGEDIRAIPLWCYSLHGLRTKKSVFFKPFTINFKCTAPSLKYSIRGTRGKYSPYFQWRGKYANKGRTLPHTHVQILLRAVKKDLPCLATTAGVLIGSIFGGKFVLTNYGEIEESFFCECLLHWNWINRNGSRKMGIWESIIAGFHYGSWLHVLAAIKYERVVFLMFPGKRNKTYCDLP